MSNTLEESGAVLPAIPDGFDPRLRRALQRLFGTKLSLQALGETATPTFDSVALSSLTVGDTVVVGTGGVLTGSGGTTAIKRCKAFCSADFNIPNSVDTAVDMDSEHFDTDSWHSNSVNPSRITVSVSGFYIVTFFVGIGSIGVADVTVSLRVNGVSGGSFALGDIVYAQPDGSHSVAVQGTCHLELSATDFVQVGVLQNSGSTVGSKAVLSVTKIGELT